MKIYTNVSEYPNPNFLVEDGVDLELFKPKNISRFDNISSRDLVVGWAGNSKWSDSDADFKGFNTILKPAVELLRKEGFKIRLHLADRQQGFIPHLEMVDFYSKIDVYICPSAIEGTPNPILESMACGVPVISTDVGIVQDVFGENQKKWIIYERSINALMDILREFYDQRDKCVSLLSKENLTSIQNWDWSIKVKKFKLFFDSFLVK